ncbi:type VI secretion system baseplate protein IglJ [Francisella tularensis]|uniref:type VI secretion system baseplate protein IglJ n=1 Tax=Francisella tularensis TaxID=263 RepID=UPI000158B004|nr:type VI secretion system baseplate protein IglJ [Francisella tularensis]AJI45747.1 hypothetical protein AS84_1193 [Francisella tularensis subsp. novicida F6168]APC98307.1 hypothetical protein KX03_1362 [Francisella tularensis subsp. novicida]EDN36632.1 predicted protein [Francisella tularensis subsp. novicida GA99-3549]
MQKKEKLQNIEDINKFCDKLSLNNLLRILANYNIQARNIKFIPVLFSSVSTPTILGISKSHNDILVKINVFKLKPFASLENIYQEYLNNDNNIAIEVLEYGIKTLLYRYIIRTKELYELTQNNTYIQAAPKYNIDNIINSLYKLLSEDYCTIISYDKKHIKIRRDPPLIGKNNVGNIFLGGYISSLMYIIKVNITLINKSESIINKIKSKIKNFENGIQNKLIKIELHISVENNIKTIKYIGDFYI